MGQARVGCCLLPVAACWLLILATYGKGELHKLQHVRIPARVAALLAALLTVVTARSEAGCMRDRAEIGRLEVAKVLTQDAELCRTQLCSPLWLSGSVLWLLGQGC